MVSISPKSRNPEIPNTQLPKSPNAQMPKCTTFAIPELPFFQRRKKKKSRHGTNTHINTQAHKYTYPDIHISAQANAHTCSHTDTQTRIYTQKYTEIHRNTQKYTHTDVHTKETAESQQNALSWKRQRISHVAS